VTQQANHLAASDQRTGPAQRDALFRQPADFLGLGHGRANSAVFEQALHQIPTHRNAMLSIPAQLPAKYSMTAHDCS